MNARAPVPGRLPPHDRATLRAIGVLTSRASPATLRAAAITVAASQGAGPQLWVPLAAGLRGGPASQPPGLPDFRADLGWDPRHRVRWVPRRQPPARAHIASSPRQGEEDQDGQMEPQGRGDVKVSGVGTAQCWPLEHSREWAVAKEGPASSGGRRSGQVVSLANSTTHLGKNTTFPQILPET